MIRHIVLYCEYGNSVGFGHRSRSVELYLHLISNLNALVDIQLIEYSVDVPPKNFELPNCIDILLIDCTHLNKFLEKIILNAKIKILISPVFDDVVNFDCALISRSPPNRSISWSAKEIVEVSPTAKIEPIITTTNPNSVTICFSGGFWFPNLGWRLIDLCIHRFETVNVVCSNIDIRHRIELDYIGALSCGQLILRSSCDIDELRRRCLYFIGGAGLMMEQAVLEGNICLSVLNQNNIWKFEKYISQSLMTYILDDYDFQLVDKYFTNFLFLKYSHLRSNAALSLWSNKLTLREHVLKMIEGD